MIKFLFKGILRDRSRSWLPIIVVALGVMLTVFLSGYIRGVMGDMTDQNSRFATGHVKIMTKAYFENVDQNPNDLALLGLAEIKQSLSETYPDMTWAPRINFGGLIDVQGEDGESRAQGPVSGLAVDLIGDGSGEIYRMKIESSIVSGNVPSEQGEVLLGYELANKLDVSLGDELVFFGSSMYGSMSFYTFVVSGTIRFGIPAMDKSAMLADIADAQYVLDMEDGTGELLGFFGDSPYDDDQAFATATSFNSSDLSSEDEFSPVMKTLKEQNDLAGLIDYAEMMSGIIVFVFVLAMSVVLWNTGLLAGLRRYQEFGIRLALGEEKGEIYRRLIMESVLIGILGSIVGTILGLIAVHLMETIGFDISDLMENTSMMLPTVIRAKMSPDLLYIGFIPGVLAMVLGTALSGIGIYKRETAQLFKELEI